jgi:hypothetical protein
VFQQLPGAAEIERALAEVYARPELNPPQPSPLRVWLSEAWAAVRRWFGSWFPSVQLDEGGMALLAWLVTALLVVVAAAVLLHFIGLLATGRRSRERRSREKGSGNREEISGPTGADEWEERARQAAAEGWWREAVLALYQALLLRLESRGTLRYDAAKTPGDYRSEVRADPAAARLFNEFLRGFEPAVYGTRRPDRQVWERLESLATEVGARG